MTAITTACTGSASCLSKYPFQKICMINFSFTCKADFVVHFVNHFNDLVWILPLQCQFVVLILEEYQNLHPNSKFSVPTSSVIILFVNTLCYLLIISCYLACFLKLILQVKYMLICRLNLCLAWPSPYKSSKGKNLHLQICLAHPHFT